MHLLNQILGLRNIGDVTKKGYQFEQIIREILPWDYKPPIVYTAPSEQLDGVFTWKGITFIIETKAKEGIITQGSHDWEDFELKLRRRDGKGIIGVFCSLYPIHENVLDAGKRLNESGIHNIILAGEFWDSIHAENVLLKDVFEFMIPYIRIKYLPAPPSINIIIEWCYDKSNIDKEFRDLALKTSSTFLRRYKHKFHDTIFVKREVDNLIYTCIDSFKPSKLRIKTDCDYKDPPKQILVIRDISGSGKTTSAVDFANSLHDFLSITVASKDNSIDNTIIDYLYHFGSDFGLSSLIKINKPIIYVVDSLDESKNQLQQKRREIIALLRFLDNLNKTSLEMGLYLFPIQFIFTVREDYWRDWENLFEDPRVQKFRKRLSSFNTNELKQALVNYSKAYNYKIINKLSFETESLLSHPINLQVLSEAVEHKGDVTITDVWETDILYSYFETKKDDTCKHPIYGFSSSAFMALLSNTAIITIKRKENLFYRVDFQNLIRTNFPIVEIHSDDILHLLCSEQILIREIDSGDKFRFKHSKFIEYLCSFYIANSVYIKNSVEHLDDLTDLIFGSGVVSMYQVHDNIRFICQRVFQSINEIVTNHYSKSDMFLERKLTTMRGNIAVGDKTNDEDLKLILKNTSSNSPVVIWDTFFVLTAKNNMQSSKIILDIFTIAWRRNNGKADRWKMLLKVANFGLLLNEKVVVEILSSNNPTEWEKYLGLVLELNLRESFKSIIEEMKPNPIMTIFKDTIDWDHNMKLLSIILTDKEYVKGELYTGDNTPKIVCML